MGPGERRKKMAAQGVVPGWSKSRDQATLVLHQIPHYSQDRSRVGKMFESIQRHYDVGLLISLSSESTTLGSTTRGSRLRGLRQSMFANIDANNFFGPAFGQLNCVVPIAAAEVDHD